MTKYIGFNRRETEFCDCADRHNRIYKKVFIYLLRKRKAGKVIRVFSDIKD